MSRLKRDLFSYLSMRGIFKNYHRTGRCSDKTEQRRRERDRSRFVWVSVDRRVLPQTGIQKNYGKGTYVRALHGELR